MSSNPHPGGKSTVAVYLDDSQVPAFTTTRSALVFVRHPKNAAGQPAYLLVEATDGTQESSQTQAEGGER